MILALTDSGAVVLSAAIAGVPATLAALLAYSAQRRTTEVRTEVRRNGGDSMRDTLEATARLVGRLGDRLDALSAETDARHRQNAENIDRVEHAVLGQNETIGTILGITARLVDHMVPGTEGTA